MNFEEKKIMKKVLFFWLISLVAFSQSHDNGWILSSNFNLPNLQFTPNTNESESGNLSIFNSAGAGIGISFSDIKSDASNVATEAKNIIGFQFGFLFSANTNKEDITNTFATTYGLSVLDFQFGLGYHHGNFDPDFKRVFYSLSYSIPLSGLADKSHLILRNKRANSGLKKENKAYFF